MELDESCSFVLELPQYDSLFDEKKELLRKKGFNTKERINLKNSAEPDIISNSLEVMVQIERIIKLDEIELYFLEDDVKRTPLGFYSHRNEIVALNSILKLVEYSLHDCSLLEKNVLTELRSLIVAKIGVLCVDGDDTMDSVIVKDRCCDKENHLLQWGRDNGMVLRLHIAYIEGAGRGMIAIEDLGVGDTALEIPASLIISEEIVKTSDMYPILKKRSEISSETMLLLWSMKEKYNSDSKFKVYFDTLPEEFNTGLSFGLDAIMVLDETMLFDEIMQAKQHLQTQYDELVPSLCNEYPDIFPRGLYTWEKFIWACELWYSNSMKIMFPDGELRTCLVPVAGFLNHSIHPQVTNYGKVDSKTNTLKFSLSRTCRATEECFLSYGNYSSSHLITFYGFIPKGDNPYDVIPLELECHDNDHDTADESQVSTVTHMTRGTWLSLNHKIFHYGLPARLLDFLRSAQNPILRTKVHLQESLESEMEILQQFCGNFEDLMYRLGEKDLDDRENTSWDVKLAIEYKDIQRKIVSSVINSCNLGLRLVEGEWCKCMEEDTRG